MRTSRKKGPSYIKLILSAKPENEWVTDPDIIKNAPMVVPEADRMDILRGVPTAYISIDENGEKSFEYFFNKVNLGLTEFQKEQFAKGILHAFLEFRKDPENMRKLEEKMKEKKDCKKGENP